MTAIYKEPVSVPVAVRGDNLQGDSQADLEVHGGPDKALYAYALEDIAWWSRELGRELPPGAFGENLTVTGLDVTGAVIGEIWAAGDAVLQVAQPRQPCFKLGIRMGDQRFVRRFAQAGRPGAYLRVITSGSLAEGDAVRVTSRPVHGITIGRVSRALLGFEDDPGAAGAPELPEPVRLRLLRHRRA